VFDKADMLFLWCTPGQIHNLFATCGDIRLVIPRATDKPVHNAGFVQAKDRGYHFA
jgi:hypothetical protein